MMSLDARDVERVAGRGIVLNIMEPVRVYLFPHALCWTVQYAHAYHGHSQAMRRDGL
jgi:hypothetical protein